MRKTNIKNKEYDVHNDYPYPKSLLYRGLRILESKGQEAFDKFAVKTRMPMQDVERIWNKYLYETDPEFRGKIGIKIDEIKAKIGVKLKIS